MITRNIQKLKEINAKIYKLREEMKRQAYRIQEIEIDEDVYAREHGTSELEETEELLGSIEEAANVADEIAERLLDLTTYIEEIDEEI